MTPSEAVTTVKELMRLPGSSAACVYDMSTERAIASKGARGMRTRHQARMARWALDSALSVTLRVAGPGDVRELMIARDDGLHTIGVLTLPDGKASVVHLVSDPDTADPRAIRDALERIRADLRQQVLLGARRTPGATWPQGAPPAVPRALLTRPGTGTPDPVPERDTSLLERVLASLRTHADGEAPAAASANVRPREGTT